MHSPAATKAQTWRAVRGEEQAVRLVVDGRQHRTHVTPGGAGEFAAVDLAELQLTDHRRRVPRRARQCRAAGPCRRVDRRHDQIGRVARLRRDDQGVARRRVQHARGDGMAGRPRDARTPGLPGCVVDRPLQRGGGRPGREHADADRRGGAEVEARRPGGEPVAACASRRPRTGRARRSAHPDGSFSRIATSATVWTNSSVDATNMRNPLPPLGMHVDRAKAVTCDARQRRAPWSSYTRTSIAWSALLSSVSESTSPAAASSAAQSDAPGAVMSNDAPEPPTVRSTGGPQAAASTPSIEVNTGSRCALRDRHLERVVPCRDRTFGDVRGRCRCRSRCRRRPPA